jgi:hypothetical protein
VGAVLIESLGNYPFLLVDCHICSSHRVIEMTVDTPTM